MTITFLDVPGMVRWVSERGVETILRDLTAAIDADFARWQEFDKTPRVASHSTEGVVELMPTSDGVTYGFKYVNGHPRNPERGFQTVTAFGVLADVGNGYPLFLSEMTILTALRTAATSAMAARRLARPGSSTMAMIGCGAQAEFQALAFRAVLGITRLRIWDTDPAAMDKLERNAVRAGFDVHRATDARDACLGADVVTTCTADKANAIVLPRDAVTPGMHLNAIGGDCPGKTELDPRTVAAARVFVEFTPQTRIEGEIQRQAADFPVTELWEVVQGRRTGRESAADVTLFDSVGFAVEDFSALRYVYDAVRADGDSPTVDLVAEPVDPKDLFAYATAAAVVAV